ncbi:family 43 glycosylhydrolase [Flavobacterium sp. Sd200]|uniref:family 43 glycosylhydrolase n=1 Tax=Flavobacterium sp. Sd200 TaxID=2692211 RepID=UPI00136860CA|nr:family 43 glycosylhydrolase [Flavobacterium sp. Sd200]MXN93098.1 family 43 glycosylhydrolase [Flavobacterium sp. Sd200]
MYTKIFSSIFLICVVSTICAQNIKNDIFWNTVDGDPIYSQGGGIFSFPDSKGVIKYYWYGVNYEEAEIYRNAPQVTLKNATFKTVTCYSSTDLVNWKFEADVMTKKEAFTTMEPTWVGRLGVAYNKELKKYAMFVQRGGKVLVAVSDTPTGLFTEHNEINMEPIIGTTNTGDQTVFTDEDSGKSYLVYCYGRGRNKIYLSEIGIKDGKIGLLDCHQIFKGESREGNCMFKHNGKYYMCASNIYGWDSSFAYYLVADNIYGPYNPVNDMKIMDGSAKDYAHVTQTGFFVSVKGSKQQTVLYCGDRWADFAGNGLGYNQWFPLSFKGTEPYFNSLSSWNLNEKTGEWNVADDNNYVMNGSFEADRNKIPSRFKPVQDHLLGWETTIVKGNKVSVDDDNSPQLNYFNTEEDRKKVIGEKSLNISDKVAFERKVSQHITSTPYVELKDGTYTLTARVKNSKGFKQLEMYAESKGKRVKYLIKGENASWQTIVIPNVVVKSGTVEIGFLAQGDANAFCYVDDITLVKAGAKAK